MSYRSLEFIRLILVVSVIPGSNQQQNPNVFYQPPQSGPGSAYGGQQQQQNPLVPYNPQNPSYNQNPLYNQNPQLLPGSRNGNGNPILPGVGLGPRDYGDLCDITSSLLYPSDENKGCNAVRGLYCNPYAQRCACIVPDAIYREGKCRAKVNKPCIGTDAVHIDCVRGSYCNALTQLCQCQVGLLSNAEETACNAGTRIQFHLAQYLLLVVIASRSIVFFMWVTHSILS